jgi:hypothetical protein
MATTVTQATIAHNLAALRVIEARQLAATTDACPKCDGPAHPMFVARFGHCTRCQNAAWGR